MEKDGKKKTKFDNTIHNLNKSNLKAVKEKYKDKILTIFQPHPSNTLQNFRWAFSKSFKDADKNNNSKYI